jgi:glutaminase
MNLKKNVALPYFLKNFSVLQQTMRSAVGQYCGAVVTATSQVDIIGDGVSNVTIFLVLFLVFLFFFA